MNKTFKSVDEEYKKSLKLDPMTSLFLYITRAKMIEHEPIVEVENKKTASFGDSNKYEVYIFRNYDEYKKYFLMYLDDVDDTIDLAIYARGKKGQIVALKGLCEYIIVRMQAIKFHNSIIKEQIAEILAKDELTTLDVLQLWESTSHKLEYDNVDFNPQKQKSKTFD